MAKRKKKTGPTEKEIRDQMAKEALRRATSKADELDEQAHLEGQSVRDLDRTDSDGVEQNEPSVRRRGKNRSGN